MLRCVFARLPHGRIPTARRNSRSFPLRRLDSGRLVPARIATVNRGNMLDRRTHQKGLSSTELIVSLGPRAWSINDPNGGGPKTVEVPSRTTTVSGADRQHGPNDRKNHAQGKRSLRFYCETIPILNGFGYYSRMGNVQFTRVALKVDR